MTHGRTLVHVRTRVAIAEQSIFAHAFETTNRVRAFRKSMARSAFETLVHILACFSVAFVSRFAAARVAAGLVEANGVVGAVVGPICAFVDVFAFNSVALVPRDTRTVKSTDFV